MAQVEPSEATRSTVRITLEPQLPPTDEKMQRDGQPVSRSVSTARPMYDGGTKWRIESARYGNVQHQSSPDPVTAGVRCCASLNHQRPRPGYALNWAPGARRYRMGRSKPPARSPCEGYAKRISGLRGGSRSVPVQGRAYGLSLHGPAASWPVAPPRRDPAIAHPDELSCSVRT